MAIRYKSNKQQHYETIIRVLEEEKDFYKKEYESMRLAANKPSFRHASPTRAHSPIRERLAEESEVKRLIREKGELQSMLDKFERHMSEVHRNVKLLTNERDKTQELYEQCNEELQRLRREMMKSPKNAKASAAAQSILRRVEAERDEVLKDVRRMSSERDALRDKLKQLTQTTLTDKAHMEQTIDDLRHLVKPMESERDELIRKLAMLRETVSTLEDQVKTQNMKISNVEQEASEFETQSNQMRILAEQTEKNLAETEYRLSKKAQDLQGSEDKCLELEQRISQLSNTLKREREDNSKLKGLVACLDRDKDGLQQDVDGKSEHISRLSQEIELKNRQMSNLTQSIEEYEQQVMRLNEELGERERELKLVRRQLEAKTYEADEQGRRLEGAHKEGQRVQNDLGELTREFQNLTVRLTGTEHDRDELKAKVLAYVKETNRLEDSLAASEQEKTDVIGQYRHMKSESSKWEQENQTSQAELSAARLELISKEGELRRQDERIKDLERAERESQDTIYAMENQSSAQHSTMNNLESQLRQLQNDKENVLADLAAVRELCVKLDGAKDNTTRKLSQKNLEFDQLNNQREDLQQELELVRKQLSAERTTIKGLEDLLTASRESEFATQLASQEREADIELFKERLSLSESKSASLQREIQSLRTRAGTAEAELERMKRQLTNERFERERSEQEVRRLKQQGRYSSPTRGRPNPNDDDD